MKSFVVSLAYGGRKSFAAKISSLDGAKFLDPPPVILPFK